MIIRCTWFQDIQSHLDRRYPFIELGRVRYFLIKHCNYYDGTFVLGT